MNKILSNIKDLFKKPEIAPLTRGQKYGLSTGVAVVLVLAVVVFLEVLSYNHNKQFDLTQDKRFTVSSETKNVMKSLTQQLKAVAFVTKDDAKVKVGDLLDQYKYASGGKFIYRFVDLNLNPGEAMTYKVTEDNTIVLIYGERQERVTLSEEDILTSGEEKLTSAIIKVLSGEAKSVYFLTGHGERDISSEEKEGFSQIKTDLESQNYAVKALDLTTAKGVPEDAVALIIAGPKKDLFDEEITGITDYLNKGGTLFVMLDPGTAARKLTAFLSKMGIAMPDDIIIDRDSKVLGGDYLIPVANMYLQHQITKDIKALSFFPYARSTDIDTKTAEGAGWNLQYLVKTGTNSWAETDIAGLRQGKAEFNKGTDFPGPVAVALIGTKKITPETPENENAAPKEAKVVVFGNSAFVANGYFVAAASNSANVDIFLNSVNWLAGNDVLISIHPKEKKASPLLLTGYQGLLIFLVTVVFIPLAVGSAGIIVFIRRRIKE